jgi:hypothetical protein
MRKLAIALITVLAMGSLTATASAAPSCSFKLSVSSVTATCDRPAYRVVVGCANQYGEWAVYGNPATAGHGKSTATCKDGQVTDYRVESNARLLTPGSSEAVCHGAVLTDYYVELV